MSAAIAVSAPFRPAIQLNTRAQCHLRPTHAATAPNAPPPATNSLVKNGAPRIHVVMW